MLGTRKATRVVAVVMIVGALLSDGAVSAKAGGKAGGGGDGPEAKTWSAPFDAGPTASCIEGAPISCASGEATGDLYANSTGAWVSSSRTTYERVAAVNLTERLSGSTSSHTYTATVDVRSVNIGPHGSLRLEPRLVSEPWDCYGWACRVNGGIDLAASSPGTITVTFTLRTDEYSTLTKLPAGDYVIALALVAAGDASTFFLSGPPYPTATVTYGAAEGAVTVRRLTRP
jgi:hypothetical protein